MSSLARLLSSHVLVFLLATSSSAADPRSSGAKDKEDDRSNDPGNHVLIDLIEARTRLENDGTGESRVHLRFQVKSTQGRDWLSQVYFPYRPEFEALRYEGVRTLHPDGKIDELAATDVLERDAPQQVPGIVHDVRVLGFAPRSLAVDDSLEFTVVRSSRKPIKPGDFWAVHDRLYPFPVRREVVVLDLPADRGVAFWSDPAHPCTTTEDGGRRVRQWELSRESYRPEERVDDGPPPPLYRVSTLTEWSQVAAWYRVLQGERARPTEEVRALALRLTEKIETPRGKAEALYAYVANEVRYLGMELGLGVIQPHSAAEVLRNGYGDCKDKHTLLAALMESAGLTAVPVLVSSQRDVAPEEPPIPFSFDHLISEVRLAEGPLWVDATIPFVPAGVLSPKLMGRKALHLEGMGGRWVDLPWRQQIPAFMRTTTTGSLAASGDLTLESSLEARGAEEMAFRTLLSIKEDGAGAETLAKVVALTWNGIEAQVSEAVAARDLAVPFRLAWKGRGRFIPTGQKRTERVLNGLGAGLEFLPELEESADEDGKAEVKEESKSASQKPLSLGGPLERTHTIRLELDPAWTVELPLPLELTTSFASYRSTYTWSDHVLEVSRKLVIREGNVPAEKKAEVMRLRKLVSRDFHQSVVFKRQADFDVVADAAGMDLATLLKAGEASAENEDPEGAATYFGQAMEKEPDNKRALEGLGDALLQMGRPDRAEEVYRHLLELSPDHEDAWNSLGLCLGTSKRAQEAEKAFLKQLEINPFHPRASLNLARLRQKQGKYEDALSWLEKAAAVDRENAYAQFLLGDVLLDLKREEQARAHLTRATELDASPQMRARVARRLTESGLDREASRATAEAIVRQASSDLSKSTIDSVAPDYAEHLAALAESLNVLGTLAMRAGRLADAESYYRAAHTVLPGEASARGLAEVLTRRDNKNEALEFWAYYRRLTGTGKPMPAGLAEHARACFGDQVEEKFDLLGRYLGSDHQLKPPGGVLHGPPAVGGVSSGVRLRAMVDAAGKVTAVRVLQGEDPFKTAAEKDLRRLPWTPLKWPGKAVDTLREVFVFYLEDGSGGGWWFYPVGEVGGQIVRTGLVPELAPASGTTETPAGERP